MKPGQKISLFKGAIILRRKEKFDWKASLITFIVIFIPMLIYILLTPAIK